MKVWGPKSLLVPERASEIAAKVERLTGEGLSLEQIAEVLNVHHRTLYRFKAQQVEVQAGYLSGLRKQAGGVGEVCFVNTRVAGFKAARKLHNVIAADSSGKETGGAANGGEAEMLELSGRKQAHGKLTAVRLLRLDPRRGAVWLCRCECGGEREVPAKSFTARHHGIKACEDCVHPDKRARQRALVHYVGPYYGLKGFEQHWLKYVVNFSLPERLLYEAYAGNRYGVHIRMEAADIVIRCANVIEELRSLHIKRVQRAYRRLRRDRFDAEAARKSGRLQADKDYKVEARSGDVLADRQHGNLVASVRSRSAVSPGAV